MDPTKLASFVAAVETGSLSRGAARLGARLSTASRHVAELEAELGARLLERTGRGVRPTAAGSRLLEPARTILRDIEAARAAVHDPSAQGEPALRLSAPPDVSLAVLPGVLAALLARHPRLRVHASTDTRRVSLVEERYDAAIRLGTLPDSGLVARSLGSLARVVCAPPELARAIRAPRDLERVELVGIAGASHALRASYRGRAIELELRPSVGLGTFAEAAELAALTARAAILPAFTAAPHLASGRLVRVLRRLALPGARASLVCTPAHRSSPVLRQLATLLRAALAAAERRAA